MLQCRTVRNIQCVRSLMMLQIATEDCTNNGMSSLPMFTTVVRRQAGSLIQNINRARAAEELRLNILHPLFVNQSFSQSGEARLAGSKTDTSTVESIQLGHALHNFLQRESKNSRHNRREKFIQLLAFPSQ